MTLPIEKLRDVRTIVVHRNDDSPCPDGVASAIFLADALPRATIRFLSHNQHEYRAIAADLGMLFCDITPPPPRAEEFVHAGALVLDHHDKQKDVVARFGSNGVYADEPAVSGAMLAFRNVWWPLQANVPLHKLEAAEQFARIAGVRDTWQKNDGRWKEACEQAEALRFYPWSRLARIVDPFGEGYAKLRSMIETVGPALMENREETTRRDAERVMMVSTSQGTRIGIVATLETSDLAEAIENVDLLVGFRYSYAYPYPPRLTFSMRSRGEYDVGALAVFLGGGGHRAAAGATVDAPTDWGPYAFVRYTVERFEKTAPAATRPETAA